MFHKPSYGSGRPSDNLKSAVTKPNRYEPHLNESLEHFAAHYGSCIYPARSGKPRDKSLVEKAVQLAYQRIYAPLRNQVFSSLAALNEAILPFHNQALFHGKDYSRRSRFEEVERFALRPLPSEKYQLQSYHTAKVHPDCHSTSLRGQALLLSALYACGSICKDGL